MFFSFLNSCLFLFFSLFFFCIFNSAVVLKKFCQLAWKQKNFTQLRWKQTFLFLAQFDMLLLFFNCWLCTVSVELRVPSCCHSEITSQTANSSQAWFLFCSMWSCTWIFLLMLILLQTMSRIFQRLCTKKTFVIQQTFVMVIL